MGRRFNTAGPCRPGIATWSGVVAMATRYMRWPVEETVTTGTDVYGGDQAQGRTGDGTCRHTALSSPRPAARRSRPAAR
jgi:hypothetical protein